MYVKNSFRHIKNYLNSIILTNNMPKRGRPIKSDIRQNIIEILAVLGKAHGYKIHKIYNEIFSPCTRENVYYNLRKGVVLNEFEVELVKETGDYSWGSVVEKKYYKLGLNAKPVGVEVVKKYFSQNENKNSSNRQG